MTPDYPNMSDTFQIVPLPNGHFRVEKLLIRGVTTAYESASFSTRREAEQWIERKPGAAHAAHRLYSHPNGQRDASLYPSSDRSGES